MNPTVRGATDDGLLPVPGGGHRDARAAARGGRPGRRGHHRRGAGLRGCAERPDGREHPQRGAARARRLPSLAGDRRTSPSSTPTAPAVEGAYQLGRGEARSGRSTEALLAAFRIGARVSWREMSTTAVRNGTEAEALVGFAELVFAYIDELSAASVAGHTDELATTGRVRQRMLERLARQLLGDAPAETVTRAAEQAGWEPPTTLTAVLVPESQVRPLLASLSPGTLQVVDLPEQDEGALLLVPDAHDRRRAALLRTLEGRGSVAGPARPWLDVRASYARALRARDAGRRGRHRGRAAPAGADRRPGGPGGPARPGARAARRAAPGDGREARPTRCARGCCTTGAARTSPRSCSCTRRRCATAWASCASCTATASTNPATVLALTSRWASADAVVCSRVFARRRARRASPADVRA